MEGGTPGRLWRASLTKFGLGDNRAKPITTFCVRCCSPALFPRHRQCCGVLADLASSAYGKGRTARGGTRNACPSPSSKSRHQLRTVPALRPAISAGSVTLIASLASNGFGCGGRHRPAVRTTGCAGSSDHHRIDGPPRPAGCPTMSWRLVRRPRWPATAAAPVGGSGALDGQCQCRPTSISVGTASSSLSPNPSSSLATVVTPIGASSLSPNPIRCGPLG